MEETARAEAATPSDVAKPRHCGPPSTCERSFVRYREFVPEPHGQELLVAPGKGLPGLPAWGAIASEVSAEASQVG